MRAKGETAFEITVLLLVDFPDGSTTITKAHGIPQVGDEMDIRGEIYEVSKVRHLFFEERGHTKPQSSVAITVK